MNYQQITLEFPALTDEAAVSLQNFIRALMYAVDEQYYRQIHRYHVDKLKNMLLNSQLTEEKLDDPQF